MTFIIHFLDELVVELARIHLSLIEFPLAHCDILQHLFSTTHQPQRGFLSDTQLEQLLCLEHSSRDNSTIYTYNRTSNKLIVLVMSSISTVMASELAQQTLVCVLHGCLKFMQYACGLWDRFAKTKCA